MGSILLLGCEVSLHPSCSSALDLAIALDTQGHNRSGTPPVAYSLGSISAVVVLYMGTVT